MRGELLKGNLELLLLAVLTEGPLHGYAAIEALKRRSGGAFDLPEGTVYPALHRLERNGLVTSRWSSESGRRRRVYALTRDGKRELAERRATWEGFTDAVAAVIA
jgi:PadR family transcriptional regulator PadR